MPRGLARAYGYAEIAGPRGPVIRSEEHTSELQSLTNLVCRLLLEKKKKKKAQAVIGEGNERIKHSASGPRAQIQARSVSAHYHRAQM